jgi:hypothetical protein
MSLTLKAGWFDRRAKAGEIDEFSGLPEWNRRD